MNVRAISEIAMNAAGHLQIKPTSPRPCDAYVYRAAAGVQWHSEALAFVAAEPQRWAPLELARHIRRVVREEMGNDLQVTSATTWIGVPVQLQEELAAELGG